VSITIGLFGTCGGSKWRDRFMQVYAEKGIDFYNPNMSGRTPEMKLAEGRHLAEDQIILFPVTDETYATGSLSEVGFSILQAIKINNRRDFVIMIAQDLQPKLKEEPLMAKESLRARALVSVHLRKLEMSNLYLVDTLDEMLEASLILHKAATLRETLAKYNPQNLRIPAP